ncbi:hypothetical protein ACP3V3_19815 [Vibrio sp. PNB22_3_1]
MPAIKKSVRLVEETVKHCRIVSLALSADLSSVNWSRSLNAITSEYALVMQEAKPELTENQWSALYSVYNGYMPSDDAKNEARLLWWHVAEGCKYDAQVAELLGTEKEAQEFCERIRDWSLATQLSAIYHAKKFWVDLSVKQEQEV